jgi:gamma-glutamyl-gamma-aminobutyrate hydrolase PuuD
MAKVKVGVAWRRDGQNQAHLGDLAVFDHSGLAGEVEVYSLAWHGAATGNGLRLSDLADMDLLVIPGGPHANATQIPVIDEPVANKPEGGTATYADQRARSELDLIERARTLGMPILALCGGSWRLIENYGGATVELAALDENGKLLTTSGNPNDTARKRHAGNMQNVATQFKHETEIWPDSLLQNATGFKPSKTEPTMWVNSVHWAVARTQRMGVRDGLARQPYPVVPNNMLMMSARDPSALQTSEAVESRHGAPVIGVQWHPEYQLPRPGGQNPLSRAANLALLQWMIRAGRAYRAHRDGIKALLTHFGAGPTPTVGSAQGVRFGGAPQHTGDPGVGPLAREIPRHKDDQETGDFGRAELAVRRYLFGLGRKPGKLFLTPVELFNLATGAPLSRIRDAEECRKGPVVAFMNANVWAQKYCNEEDKKKIAAWPAT